MIGRFLCFLDRDYREVGKVQSTMRMEKDTRWLPAAQGHYRAGAGFGDHLLPP